MPRRTARRRCWTRSRSIPSRCSARRYTRHTKAGSSTRSAHLNACSNAASTRWANGANWSHSIAPPFSGPLNAVAAGMAQVPARIVVLVGGDMPRVGLAVPSLARLAATTDRAAALVDATGTVQPLASAWPRDVLVAALDTLRPLENRPVRHLLAAVLEPVGQVLDEWGAANDVDFPTDLG